MPGGDVGDRPAAGIARQPQPQQGDLRRRQAGFALARIGLEAFDGANRVDPILRREPPCLRYEMPLRERTVGGTATRDSTEGSLFSVASP